MTLRSPPEMPAEYELLLRRKVKAELRERMRGLRKTHPAEARAERSRAIAARVAELPEWKAAKRVAGFVSVKAEVDVGSLLDAARAEGRTVLLPRVGEDDVLRFHAVAPGGVLVKSAFGVPEPDAAAPVETPDLVLVPGLAFDERGHRIGYGAGYYDRFLAGAVADAGAAVTVSIGVAFDFQLAPELPDTPGDVAVRIVVTDARVVRPSK